MARRALLLILLSLSIVTAFGCRHRRTPPKVDVVPPAVTETSAPVESTPVTNTETDFVQPQPEPGEVISTDIVEANRQAHERGWIRDAFFGLDASTLDADAQAALTASAAWLRQHPEYRVRVEGHCDERGTEQYNLALGDRRAETAVAFLATLGIERGRIETVSYGEERPFEEGSNDAAWAQNRRAHLVLAGKR
ncbi:MAG: peptidoglycan-associated lipoprotein [Acidobacteriota bacterium]|jgi:peptidoglycan-associated lipoprotein|nr:peptidoglycan-associated lipoprotein [Acidobacteriota bacterium]